ncbi:serine/threonine-protein kinase [Sandaracinus amylolyticus]|uniref:Serine/threonine protein kinase PrkC, regulator of stationary phase n=1 Tax=Sandaracinus amylolyticus TaxID=927083 RepID=A0A0F6SD68_9BACT|nr:serine/threonine-protein kinase [Sandaracinus amylolyticus]AKF02919.1 Serine/threonine protein kinase PrkC, regulator of stationary phase [Sandaracinus amylolyticus]
MVGEKAPSGTESPDETGAGAIRDVEQSGEARAQRAPASLPPPGETLPRELTSKYRLDSLIAIGGMGRVYRATQLPLDRKVAIKLLAIQKGADDFRKRFFLEASISSRLKHPNIVTVHDYGETADGGLFMVMELLDGEPLTEVLAREVRIEPARACRIAMEICRALRAAHRESLAHRDLKPGNVMITRGEEDESEHVKVLDFGLVKVFQEKQEIAPLERDLTRGETMLGSPRYMAPEQIVCDPVDNRTDIYALGVVLFSLVTGQVPFGGKSAVAILQQHLNAPVPSLREKIVLRPGETRAPELPAGLEAIIKRCMEKRPSDRFQTVAEIMQALARIDGAATSMRSAHDQSVEISASGPMLGGLRAPSELPGTTPTPQPMPAELKPSRARTGAMVAVVLGAAAVAGLLAWGGGASPEPAPTPVVAAEPPRATRVVVTSDPAGAEVRARGEVIGTTPLEQEIPGERGERVELELALEGHRAARVPAVLQGDSVAVHVELQELAPVAPPPPPVEIAAPIAEPPPAATSSPSRTRRSRSETAAAAIATPPPPSSPPPATTTSSVAPEAPRRGVVDDARARSVPVVD